LREREDAEAIGRRADLQILELDVHVGVIAAATSPRTSVPKTAICEARADDPSGLVNDERTCSSGTHVDSQK
jgi:hypothetical protein